MSENGENLFSSGSFIPEGLHRAPRILVVDDDPAICKLLRFHLKRSGCEVVIAPDGETALRVVEDGPPVDLALLDLNLPGISGLETLQHFQASDRIGCVILMTAAGTMDDAISALKGGAYDFVNKSASFDDVRMAIRNALETVGLREEVEHLKMRLGEMEGGLPDMVGKSKPFNQVMKLVRKVMNSDITVLIQGESGTGKELIARAIHFQGQFRHKPFVAINCAAIPENLLESELFGHEKGAFTGADSKRIGKFEEANEGTLFLDEIGALSTALQAKLLRVLQTREIEPIGGRMKRVKVRFISATNSDLAQAIRSGGFREDLYYRLAVFPIQTPPLRERTEDIPLLVQYFLDKFSGQENKIIKGVETQAMARLRNYPWHGNVRELENVIYRAVVLTESAHLTLDDFPNIPPVELSAVSAGAAAGNPSGEVPSRPSSMPSSMAPPHPAGETGPAPGVPAEPEHPAPPAPATWKDREIAAIRDALAATGGNMSKAALHLKIGRATLYRKSKKYGILRQ
ncbi:MAG: sigma-54 dependent transcriptional regulator [bacterium]